MLPFLTWLAQGAVGPALFGMPFTSAATNLAGAAKKWFRRLRRSDDLSRIVRAAAGGDVELSDHEFDDIRSLLEQQSTWVVVGDGRVEELAALIASRLPRRVGEGSLAAGRAIAGGLLEFAICDLEPEWFRQVLFARLDRLETNQATALDEAMLSVHADLAAMFAVQDAATADRFACLMSQLVRVLERLPPDPAGQHELTVYLAGLARWLSTDPWPEDTRFGGSALIPAAIERNLRIADSRVGQDLSADDLARRCTRLVVLGGPGSGKTWLAKRSARLCAEAALDALAAGAGTDEVELPLYTTCARLAAAPLNDGIRRAVVGSALGQIPDLGGSRVLDAVRELFENRDAPTLLVADSLDEARNADNADGRIRQADTLPTAWRIVLTSRPASWNRQLAIGNDDPSRRVGILQPLRYPNDVESFITGWFTGRPELAASLAAQLRYRPALQQAATVPLILAFYCVLGGEQPLPGRHVDLYAKVIRRMLTGRWRGSGDRDPDPDACLDTLRDWAWSAVARDLISGVGAWEDDFPTLRVRQSQDDRDALDHVAVPLGAPDVDTGMTQRRFVHRSLHEHLVAEHVALQMPAEEAAGELLNHLWYDPDWEYAGPAALAMHPQRDQVLKNLICLVTGSREFFADLAAIDGCWEMRRFLVRVAMESSEDDWLPEAVQIIGRARLDLAKSQDLAESNWRWANLRAVAASDWPTSNGLIIDSVLADEAEPVMACRLAEAAAWLDPAAEERARMREAVPALLARRLGGLWFRDLANAAVQLAVTAEERARAREALLGLLADETDTLQARDLANAFAGLDPAAEERARAREALLALLAGEIAPTGTLGLTDSISRLSVTAEERARAREALLGLLAAETDPWRARYLANAFAGLDPAAEERARAREALLALLAGKIAPTVTRDLTDSISRLSVTAEERARAREALLGLLAGETNRELAYQLADSISRLSVTAEERARAREALLGLLADETNPDLAWGLAAAVAGLDPATEERARARKALLGLLGGKTDTLLARQLVRLAVTAEERARTREALLGLLASETTPWMAKELADTVARLDPTTEERTRIREALLGLLASETNSSMAQGLADTVTWLDPSTEERARACETLLRVLASETIPSIAKELTDLITRLAATAEERAQARDKRARAREALLGLLASETGPQPAEELADAAVRLAVTAEERAQAREALLGLLASDTNPRIAYQLADAAARLAVTAEERAQARDKQARAREALLGLLASETDPRMARVLGEAIAQLSPTAADLAGWDRWPLPPRPALLAAARQNSKLPAWLTALRLSSLAPGYPTLARGCGTTPRRR